jgi:hypothetical protein
LTVIVQEPETRTDRVLAYKGLIDDVLWGRLTDRIVKDHNMDRSLAERVMNEALGFLKLCGMMPVVENYELGGFRPSELVDVGWHTFLLYTREYAAFCARIAEGRFIHHNPSDVPGVVYPTVGNTDRTIDAMRVHGPVDMELWAVTRADCSDHCGAGGGDGK